MNVLVSIVTPCLNPGERLVRCAASIEAQRGASVGVEHIVIDGASTDGTVERLAGMPWIKWTSAPDSGAAQAINRGLAMATGDVVGWLGADDEFTDGSLAASVAALEANERAGWSYGDVIVVEDGHRWTRRGRRRVDRAILERENPLPQPGALLRRSTLDRIGPLDERLQLAFDVDLWVRLVDAGIPSVYVPRTLARFEIHSSSKSGSASVAAWIAEDLDLRVRRGWTRGAALFAGRLAGRSGERGIALVAAVDAVLAERGLADTADRAVALVAARAEVALADGSLWRQLRGLADPRIWGTTEVRALLLSRAALRLRRGLARSARDHVR